MKATVIYCLAIILALIVVPCYPKSPDYEAAAKPECPRRPATENAALFARWLVCQSTWGVLSTLDVIGKAPFGNIHSFADAATGSPYFYQSQTLERTGQNAVNDGRSSFALTEYVLGYCDHPIVDPQSPLCAKITLSGQLQILDKNSSEAKFGEAALFAKHPQFEGFPKQMNFDVFKLEIKDIFLVNMAARPTNVSVADYFNVKL